MTGLAFEEAALVQSERKSSTATCKITIPFSWYGADAKLAIQPFVTLHTKLDNFPGVTDPVVRRVRATLPSFTVPAGGKTETIKVKMVL